MCKLYNRFTWRWYGNWAILQHSEKAYSISKWELIKCRRQSVIADLHETVNIMCVVHSNAFLFLISYPMTCPFVWVLWLQILSNDKQWYLSPTNQRGLYAGHRMYSRTDLKRGHKKQSGLEPYYVVFTLQQFYRQRMLMLWVWKL